MKIRTIYKEFDILQNGIDIIQNDFQQNDSQQTDIQQNDIQETKCSMRYWY